ncbi:MAG: peptide chain release factor aRF-1 [archaeon]
MNNVKSKYEFKKLKNKLENVKGNGTELISIYLPPHFKLNNMIKQLEEEKETAQNIKSKRTRKNVTTSLKKIINFLKKYSQNNNRKTNKKGLAIFCGDISEKEGKTDIQLYWIEPSTPINSKIYKCDKSFVLHPLMQKQKEKIGLIAIDSKEATIAKIQNNNINILKQFESNVWSEHKKGGQSQQRFERLRDEELHNFFKTVSETVNTEFSKDRGEIKGILVGGPGPNKRKFVNEDYLDTHIKDKILQVYDIGYSNKQGIKELVNNVNEVLNDLQIIKDKKLIEKFKEGVVSDKSIAVYGIDEVRKYLKRGMVDTLLISEEVKLYDINITCDNCGNNIDIIVENKNKIECDNCGNVLKIENIDTIDVVEDFCNIAESMDSDIKFISTNSEEGKQFYQAFNGIGAFLRYQVK